MGLKDLTIAEEQVMQVIWGLEKGFVKEVLNVLPEPTPAYNTLSAIMRSLEGKGFLGHQAFGKAHQYYPLISKAEYTRQATQLLLDQYDDPSIKNMVTILVKEEKVDLSNIEEILKMIDQVKNRPR